MSVRLQVVEKDKAETELVKTTMGVFVLREDKGPLCKPVEIGIIIDGVEVFSPQLLLPVPFCLALSMP